MFDAGQDKVVHWLPRQIIPDISCKHLVETEQPVLWGFKDSFFWQQDERSQAKQSEMGCTCMTGWFYGIDWYQLRWTYRPAYHTEWYSEDSKVCKRDPKIACRTLRSAAIAHSFLLMQAFSRNHTTHLMENFLEVETIQRMK
ncbi:hypothetical protein TNCV_3966661 [Trichonephila clavipes]|nr:hypothetical protein TNCV_3966661 [Trichonephila clavipes]